MTTIYEMLQQDHQKVKEALTKMLDTSNGSDVTRTALFDEIKHDLEVHTSFEEEVFYPRFREAKGDKEAKAEVGDALDEHAEAESMLDKLDTMDKASDDFLEKVKELKEALEHHISDEEEEMFPQARKVLNDEIVEEMAERYREAKAG